MLSCSESSPIGSRDAFWVSALWKSMSSPRQIVPIIHCHCRVTMKILALLTFRTVSAQPAPVSRRAEQILAVRISH